MTSGEYVVPHLSPRASPAHDARRGTKRTVSKEGIASRTRRLRASQEEILRARGLRFWRRFAERFWVYAAENNDTGGAIQVFKLNAEMFPDSSNVWDSLAEGYLKAGNVKKAQQNYEKALSFDPANQSAKDALQKIKESQPK